MTILDQMREEPLSSTSTGLMIVSLPRLYVTACRLCLETGASLWLSARRAFNLASSARYDLVSSSPSSIESACFSALSAFGYCLFMI